MKYSNKKIGYVWAAQNEERGEGSHLFFEKNKIYSWGYHFEIARILDFPQGKIVLFTNKGYSNSTAKHKACVYYAIANMQVFTVPNFEILDNKNAHKENLEYMYKTTIEERNKVLRKRTRSAYDEERVLKMREEFFSYAHFFKLKIKAVEKETLENLFPDPNPFKQAIKDAIKKAEDIKQ